MLVSFDVLRKTTNPPMPLLHLIGQGFLPHRLQRFQEHRRWQASPATDQRRPGPRKFETMIFRTSFPFWWDMDSLLGGYFLWVDKKLLTSCWCDLIQ